MMGSPPLNLHLESLDDPEPWIIEKQMFEILDQYLDPSNEIPASSVAIAVNKLAPMNREVGDGETVEHEESFLLETWGIFVKIAKQINYNHPAQGRLIDLLSELAKLPSVLVSVWGQPLRLWTDFPFFAPEMREQWIYPGRSEDDNRESFRRWENHNAFAARMCGAGLMKWRHFGFWTISEALEECECPWQQQRHRLAVSHVRAAALWIEFARHSLYESIPTQDGKATSTSESEDTATQDNKADAITAVTEDASPTISEDSDETTWTDSDDSASTDSNETTLTVSVDSDETGSTSSDESSSTISEDGDEEGSTDSDDSASTDSDDTATTITVFRNGSNPPNQPRPSKPDGIIRVTARNLWGGPVEVTEERWRFWTNRFREIAESDSGVQDEIVVMCRVLAARAAGLMTEMTIARENSVRGNAAS